MSTARRLLRVLRQRCRSLVDRRAQDDELDDELAFHLEQLTREEIDAGLPPEDARAAARRAFGNVAALRERARDARRLGWLDDLRQDVRHGARVLRRSPGFALVAMLSLGVGIGAATTVLATMQTLFGQPLPFAHSERLVIVRTTPADDGTRQQGATMRELLAWRAASRTIDAIAASASAPRELSAEPGLPGERLSSQAFTPGYFQLLGVRPALGRVFDDGAGQPAQDSRAIVLSHGLWQRRYGGAADVIGRTVPTQTGPRTIVGVMPPTFHYQDSDVAFWIPLPEVVDPDALGRPLFVLARLAPGATVEEAQAELTAIAEGLVSHLPARFRGRGVRVLPLRDVMYGWTQPLLVTLLAAVALMLTIACANVAGLMLARATTRRRELWVRASLGAGRGRLIRQLLAEHLVASLGGVAIAAIVARVGLRTLAAAMGPPPGAPRVAALPFDATAAATLLVVSVIAIVASGLAPAIAAGRPRARGTTTPPGDGGDRDATRARGVLVTGEVAFATVLLVGAGLLLNSFLRLVHRELNFDPDRLASFQYVIEPDRFAQRIGFDGLLPLNAISPMATETIARVHERLRLVPGVVGVGGATYHPVNAFIKPRFPVQALEGAAGGPGVGPIEMVSQFVTPDFLTTLGTPILKGRDVKDTDGRAAPAVVVINDAAARLLFPDRDALGGLVVVELIRGAAPREVIGVAANVPIGRKQPQAEPIVYIPSRQIPPVVRAGGANIFGHMTFVLRYAGDETAVVRAARAAVAEIDPQRPIVNVGVVTRALQARVPEQRNYVGAVSVFGVAALLLAAMGVYGVTAATVAARTRELGIRRALGADTRDVVLAIGRRATWLTGSGLAIGLAVAALLTQLMASQLIDVAPTDPATFALAAALLITVAALACVSPARRALRVDPATVLRVDG